MASPARSGARRLPTAKLNQRSDMAYAHDGCVVLIVGGRDDDLIATSSPTATPSSPAPIMGSEPASAELCSHRLRGGLVNTG